MTPAQLATFKADILARYPTPTTRPSDIDIATFYNTPTTNPVVKVWKPVVTIKDLNAVIAWADFAALSLQFQMAWQTMIWNMSIDMTDAQVRQGVGVIFGAPMPVASLNGVNNTAGRRTGTYFECLFPVDPVPAIKVSVMFGVLCGPQDVTDALTS